MLCIRKRTKNLVIRWNVQCLHKSVECLSDILQMRLVPSFECGLYTSLEQNHIECYAFQDCFQFRIGDFMICGELNPLTQTALLVDYK